MTTEDHKVLLVDDADFFLETEKAFLKQTPATIYTASNGAEALDMAVQYRPDLIYMDVQMPVMDGLVTLQALKANPVLQTIPVIMVFTPTRDVTMESIQKTGCAAAITKPIDRTEFLEVGHQFLFGIDRREHRVSCQMTVDFTMGGQQLQGMCIDISDNGLYVQYRHPLPEVKEVELSFLMPTVSSEKLQASAVVRWVNQGFPRPNLGTPQGFGVKFTAIEGRFQEIIRSYVEKYR